MNIIHNYKENELFICFKIKLNLTKNNILRFAFLNSMSLSFEHELFYCYYYY